LMKNLSPESAEYQQAQARDLAKYATEINRLEAKFEKKNFWHGRQVLQIAQDVDMGPLYKTAYKTASGITHGSSYPILSRDKKMEWVIGFERSKWNRYAKESPVFGYLMLVPFYMEVFRLLQISDTSNLNEMADVSMKLAAE